MIHFNMITMKNTFTVFLLLLSLLTKDVYSEWNTRDYMKREHSLLKPYQGN